MTRSPRQTPLSRACAKAALILAVREQSQDVWERFLYAASFAVQHPRVRLRLRDLSLRAPQEALAAVCAPVLFDAAHNLLKLLAMRKSLGALPAIAERFSHLRREQEKRLRVEVVSAVPLSDEESAQLQARLAANFQRAVMLACKVDAALLGGLRVRIGDQVLDLSLRGRLNRLKGTLS